MRALITAVVVTAAYFGLLFAIIRWMRSRLYNRVLVAANALAAAGARVGTARRPGGFRRPAEVDFELDGTAATYQVQQYGRDFILQSVRIASEPLPAMLVRPERALDRLGKSLGLNREAQLGDDGFDAAAYIETAAPDALVREALASAAARAQVLQLLGAGYRVETSATGLRAMRVRGFYAAFEAPEVPGVLRALASIRDAMPRFDPAALTHPSPARLSRAVLASFLVLLLGIASFPVIAAMRPLINPMHGLIALAIGLVVWLAVVAALGYGLRQRPHGIQELLIAALSLMFGVPPLCTAALVAANAGLDHGPVTTHAARVVALHRHDHEVSYVPWVPGRQHASISVDRAVFHALHVGDTIEIDTRPGALGWPWAATVRRSEVNGP